MAIMRNMYTGLRSAGGAGTLGDEMEDLYMSLCDVKAYHPDPHRLSVGAILSDYQCIRVKHVRTGDTS